MNPLEKVVPLILKNRFVPDLFRIRKKPNSGIACYRQLSTTITRVELLPQLSTCAPAANVVVAVGVAVVVGAASTVVVVAPAAVVVGIG